MVGFLDKLSTITLIYEQDCRRVVELLGLHAELTGIYPGRDDVLEKFENPLPAALLRDVLAVVKTTCTELVEVPSIRAVAARISENIDGNSVQRIDWTTCLPDDADSVFHETLHDGFALALVRMTAMGMDSFMTTWGTMTFKDIGTLPAGLILFLPKIVSVAIHMKDIVDIPVDVLDAPQEFKDCIAALKGAGKLLRAAPGGYVEDLITKGTYETIFMSICQQLARIGDDRLELTIARLDMLICGRCDDALLDAKIVPIVGMVTAVDKWTPDRVQEYKAMINSKPAGDLQRKWNVICDWVNV